MKKNKFLRSMWRTWHEPSEEQRCPSPMPKDAFSLFPATGHRAHSAGTAGPACGVRSLGHQGRQTKSNQDKFSIVSRNPSDKSVKFHRLRRRSRSTEAPTCHYHYLSLLFSSFFPAKPDQIRPLGGPSPSRSERSFCSFRIQVQV